MLQVKSENLKNKASMTFMENFFYFPIQNYKGVRTVLPTEPPYGVQSVVNLTNWDGSYI